MKRQFFSLLLMLCVLSVSAETTFETGWGLYILQCIEVMDHLLPCEGVTDPTPAYGHPSPSGAGSCCADPATGHLTIIPFISLGKTAAEKFESKLCFRGSNRWKAQCLHWKRAFSHLSQNGR